MRIALLLPHQLFEENPLLPKCDTIYLVEESLYFKQFRFHKQKIAFHRASMKFYEQYLISKKMQVVYIDANNELADIRNLITHFHSQGYTSFTYIDTTDYWIEHRIAEVCRLNAITAQKIQSPLFLNTQEENIDYFSDKRRFFQTDYYKYQRKQRNILIERDHQPSGGKWTYDEENRQKYPAKAVPPVVENVKENHYLIEAKQYVENYFSDHYGQLNADYNYPTTFADSKKWLADFFETRFSEFGAYEDAIVSNQQLLHHSLVSPLLNAGLLTPQYVVDEALKYAREHSVPLNSVEGFIRQIIGWREFIRAVYEMKGREERIKNFWEFKRKIPRSFWNGTTGIYPLDCTIKKVLETGYCHHIERLMVIGNFMVLCEFDPDEVYAWFMELFIDAYDWVMVPNVYGMSQFADGGLMSTKPYISGSNYLMKMSDYKKGDWQIIWDALFWRFMHVHRDFFMKNPRIGMLVKTFDNMPEEKQKQHITTAENYLSSLA